MDDKVYPFFLFVSWDRRRETRQPGALVATEQKAGGRISCTRDSFQKIKIPPDRELGRGFDYIWRENKGNMTEFMTKDLDYPLSSRVVTGVIYHSFVKASSLFNKNVFVKKVFVEQKYCIPSYFNP